MTVCNDMRCTRTCGAHGSADAEGDLLACLDESVSAASAAMASSPLNRETKAGHDSLASTHESAKHKPELEETLNHIVRSEFVRYYCVD